MPPIIERRKRGTGLSVNHPFSYILSGDSGLHYFTLLAAAPPRSLKDRAKGGNLAGHGVFADRTFNSFWRGSDRELAIIDSV